MVSARFRVDLPGDVWISDVSRDFPAATFRLLAGAPSADGTVELGEVLAEDPGTVLDGLAEHPDVRETDVLFVGDGRGLVTYETSDPRLFAFLGGADLPPEFPLSVQAGVMEFDLTAAREQFDTFVDVLDAGGFEYTLLSLVHESSPSGVLTERQRHCLEEALRMGYLEVPRSCTLAELAASLDVDKSTASETIRRAEARIVDWFLLESN